jgi:hypothetical protein
MSFKVRRVRLTFLALAEHRWTDNMARVGFFYLWKTTTLRNDGNKLQILSFLFRVLLVSKQQCDLFSPGRWMESQLTVIPHSTLRCVWKRLKNHLLSTPPPLLLVPYKGPQYPLPGRKCGNNITTETKSFRLFLSLTGKNFLKKTKNKRRNVF